MKVRVAIVGVGNCASALVQGVHFYRNGGELEVLGLTKVDMGGITPNDIEFVAAFDVAETKVGKDLSEAIFQFPNNTVKVNDVPNLNVPVQRGPVLDGLGKYLSSYVQVAHNLEADVVKALEDSAADVVVNYLPVGSTRATEFYAESAVKAGCAFINAMPVFIASDSKWAERFQQARLPVAGDDVMSQLGATVLHKSLVKLFVDRGVKLDETYQLNIGGDTDFLNMLEESRLVDKRESKTSAVRAMLDEPVPIRIGPSDYVEFLKNDKVCYVWARGRGFGGVPIEVDVKLRVVDAYNSGGIMVDAVRGVKIALERRISGPLISLSAYCFKHPPVQMPYQEAKVAFTEFIEGTRDR